MKKVISILICLCVFISSFCISTYAEGKDYAPFYDSEMVMLDFSVDKKINNMVYSPTYYYSSDFQYSTTYDCYDKLSAAQKYIYDKIVENAGSLTFDISFEKEQLSLTELQSDNFLNQIINAVSLDRPDIFYFAGCGYEGGSFYTNTDFVAVLNFKVATFDKTIGVNYYDNADLLSYYIALCDAVKNVPVNLTNRYNFIKSLHDYLCKTVYYPDINSADYVTSAHDAYGALVENRAVCQGYSDAIKLVCDYYNIPCVCISGTAAGGGHMWNAIQMDDGRWYFIDATWNDQGDYGTFYDFFLVGEKSVDTYFSGIEFSEEHINDADLFLPLLNYAENAYSQTNHNTKFDATYNSLVDEDNMLLYLSVFDAGKTNIYYNGMYVPVNNYSTGETVTVGSNLNYQMVILGDANGDGNCDPLDYSLVINASLADDKSVSNIDERAYDINRDGYVDILDSYAYSLMSNGIDTHIELS